MLVVYGCAAKLTAALNTASASVGSDTEEGAPTMGNDGSAKIAQRLARIRLAFSDQTQKDWAQLNNFEVTQYNNWERGARRIPVDSAMVLCQSYGLTLDYIYTGRMDAVSISAAVRLGLRQAAPNRKNHSAPNGHDVGVVGDDGLEPPTSSV